MTDDANDPFGGAMKGITSEVRNGAAKNLLNFSVDGSAQLYNPAKTEEGGSSAAEDEVLGEYVIDVDVDIDIFVLLDLVYSVKYKDVVSVDENGDPVQAVDADGKELVQDAMSDGKFTQINKSA